MLRKELHIVLAMLLCGLLLPSIVRGEAKKTPFTGTETQTVPPAGGRWFTDGQVFIVMGSVSENLDEMTDPRVSGTLWCYGNGVVDVASGTGPMWGPFHLENEDGAWDGFWRGMQGVTDGPFVIAVGVGSGKYEGLIVHTEYYLQADGPLLAEGYIVEAKGGPADRPLKVSGSRVDQLEIHMGMMVDTGEPGIMGTVEIVSATGQSSHLGRATDQGIGVLDPETGAVSMLGWSTAANGDLAYWVAMGETDLGTGVFSGDVGFMGGTGRFESATGGFDLAVQETPDPDDPTVFWFDYDALGTIRY